MRRWHGILWLRTSACGLALAMGCFIAADARACTYSVAAAIGIGGPPGVVQDYRLKERRYLEAQIKRDRREAATIVQAGSIDYAASISRSMVPAIRPMYSNGCGLEADGEPDPAGSMGLDAFARDLKALSEAGPNTDPDDLPMQLLREAEPIFRSCNDEFRERVAMRLRETVGRETLARVWQTLRGEGFDLLSDDEKVPRERLPRVMRFANARAGKLEFNNMAHPRIESGFPDIAQELRDRQSKRIASLVASDPAFLTVVSQIEAIVAELKTAAMSRQALCPNTMDGAKPVFQSIKQSLELAAERRQARARPVTQSN